MKIKETIVYEIWKDSKFRKNPVTSDGQVIEIVDPGIQNKDLAGPDFLNARVKFGNITYLGDIEIDAKYSDWKSHGHYFDKKYNKVILHISISDEKIQPFVYTKDNRKINSINLLKFIDEDIGKTLHEAVSLEQQNRSYYMPCTGRNSSIPGKTKINFLVDLGIERFQNKSRRTLERIKQMIYLREMNIREPVVRYDFGEDFMNRKFKPKDFSDVSIWQQIVYESIFEALGYSKNKDMMLKLSRAVNISFLQQFKDESNFIEILESILLNVGGLLPDKISFDDERSADYVRKLTELWNSIKHKYDGLSFKQEQWHFFKLRPQNFPTIRIAGGARLIDKLLNENLFNDILAIFEYDGFPKDQTLKLRNLLVIEAEDFWLDHFVFDRPSKEKLNYFIGVARADEIIINVLLPVLVIYFEIFSQNDEVKRVKELYINYNQKTSNQVVNQVNDVLNLGRSKDRSICYQGMIELFRNYCVKERCLDCKIGKQIFD